MVNPVSLYWTGVGSRETPDTILKLMRLVARVMTDLGWILRSGGADGADSAFYDGCKDSSRFNECTPYVYLSWNGMFNGREKLYENIKEGFYLSPNFPTWEAAGEIALKTRGSFERLGRGGIAHHTRNVYQVIGHDLASPSRFLMCWAQPVGKQGFVKGGTNTAVKLALAQNVEVINLYTMEGFNRAVAFLDKHDVDHDFLMRVA